MQAYMVDIRGCDTVVVAAENLHGAIRQALMWANDGIDEGDTDPLSMDDVESVQNLAQFVGVWEEGDEPTAPQ